MLINWFHREKAIHIKELAEELSVLVGDAENTGKSIKKKEFNKILDKISEIESDLQELKNKEVE